MSAGAERGSARDLRPLFDPRAVAVVGASPTARVGANLVRNLQQMGYGGRIYPINPNYPEVFGLRCYPSLAAVPEPVDAVAFGVGAERVLPVLAEAGQAGVRAAMIPSGGFAESGAAGGARQQELQQLAAAHGLLVCGPNCMGIISFVHRQAMYIGGIPSGAVRGRVGAVCQSGSVGISLLQSGRLALSHLISTGNEAVVEAAEYLGYLVEDPETDVLVAFLEGVRAPARLLQVADRARALGKPLIVLKVGSSAGAVAATLAHTGALAGSAAVTRAALRQHGVIQVDDVDALIETAALYAALGSRRPRGAGVGIITASGGHVSLALDVAERVGLPLPPLAAATCDELAAVLNHRPTVSNPLDAWGTGDTQTTYPRCLALLAADPAVDLIGVCQDAAATDDAVVQNPLRVARAAAALAATTDKPLVFFTTTAGAVHAEVAMMLAAAGVPLLRGMVPSLAALAALVRAAGETPAPTAAVAPPPPVARQHVASLLAMAPPGVALRGKEPGDALTPPLSQRERELESANLSASCFNLSEHASLQVLAAYGVPVARHRLVQSAAEAVAAAETLGFPVALKVCSPDLPHKTEAGAVRLGLADAAAVAEAYAPILANAHAVAPAARIEGVLVQEMVGGVELIAGLSHDAIFGPTVLLGLGGVLAEVLRDVTLRLAPLAPADAAAMIAELRGAALLDGWRGQPAADRAAIVNVLLGLSRLALDWPDAIAAVDINPLLVSATGAVAADALVVCRQGLT